MTKILHKRGSGEPDAESLDVGEIALDTSAGAAYTKLSNGTVVEIGGGGGGIEEAPKTGKMYARKDEAWEEFATANIDDINADINELREDFENHDHALDDLSDVNAGSPARDNLLIFNGSQWVSDEWAFIDTALRFKGGISPTAQAPANPEGGDLYVFDSDGTISASWGAIAGEQVEPGKFVGYAADTHNRWYLLGNMADIGVVNVSPGIGIDVDDSKPSEPVVSVDRDEVDKWYAAKGDIVWKQNGSDIYYDDGNVGIGATSPRAPLDIIASSGNASSYLDARKGNGLKSGWFLLTKSGTGSDVGGAIYHDGANNTLNLSNDTSFSSPDLTIDSSGNVGIGTDKIDEVLVVQGGVKIRGTNKLSFTNTSDQTYIHASSSNTLSFATDSTPRMCIDGSGRVGIGTDSPSSMLEIVAPDSSYRARTAYEDSTGNSFLIGTWANRGTISAINCPIRIDTYSADPITFWTNSGSGGTERVRIDASGRVGIGGEPSRSTKEIEDEAEATLRNWDSKDKKPTKAELIKRIAERNIGGGTSLLQVAGDGYFSGNVGIGATGMTQGGGGPLQVYSTSGPQLILGKDTGAPAISFGSTTTQYGLIEGITGGGFIFYTGNGTVSSRVFIDASGRVGIGGRPSRSAERSSFVEIGGGDAKLQVAGDGYFRGTVNATTINGKVTDVADHIKAITPTQIANWDAGTGGGGGGATTDGRISDDQIVHWDQAYQWGNHADAGYQPAGDYLTPSSLNGYATESWVSSNYQPKGNYQPAGNYLTSIASGNGTKVTGNKVEMSGSYTGTFTATGDIVAYSDVRLKENIRTLDGSKVFDMRGVSFDRDGKPSSGVIAQELREVAPELVHDDGENLGVAYGNLVGYLIEAVKELKAEVEELKRG